MKLERFEKVSTLKEAYDLMQQDENVVIGGGGWLKLTHIQKQTGIDLENLNLDYIRKEEDGYHIGAMTTLRTIEQYPEFQFFASGMVANAASRVMGVTIRNLVTIGGSICGKYGFSDVTTMLLALNAQLVFYKTGNMGLESFLEHKGKMKDLLLEAVIPAEQGKGFFDAYKKTSLDFSIINMALTSYNGFNIAIGSRPGSATLVKIPMHSEVYDALVKSFHEGKLSVDTPEIDGICKQFTFGTNPKASKEYRFELAKVFVMHGIKEVLL